MFPLAGGQGDRVHHIPRPQNGFALVVSVPFAVAVEVVVVRGAPPSPTRKKATPHPNTSSKNSVSNSCAKTKSPPPAASSSSSNFPSPTGKLIHPTAAPEFTRRGARRNFTSEIKKTDASRNAKHRAPGPCSVCLPQAGRTGAGSAFSAPSSSCRWEPPHSSGGRSASALRQKKHRSAPLYLLRRFTRASLRRECFLWRVAKVIGCIHSSTINWFRACCFGAFRCRS